MAHGHQSLRSYGQEALESRGFGPGNSSDLRWERRRSSAIHGVCQLLFIATKMLQDSLNSMAQYRWRWQGPVLNYLVSVEVLSVSAIWNRLGLRSLGSTHISLVTRLLKNVVASSMLAQSLMIQMRQQTHCRCGFPGAGVLCGTRLHWEMLSSTCMEQSLYAFLVLGSTFCQTMCKAHECAELELRLAWSFRQWKLRSLYCVHWCMQQCSDMWAVCVCVLFLACSALESTVKFALGAPNLGLRSPKSLCQIPFVWLLDHSRRHSRVPGTIL